MNLKIFILLIFCIWSGLLSAQDIFVPYGKITFEKKVNLIRSLENSGLPQEAKEKMQKYANSNWEFFFDQNKSVYRPEKNDKKTEERSIFFFSPVKSSNELYTDYNKNHRTIKRRVMDDDYLLTDTIPQVQWKILQDVRNIAGYECRKAIGTIYDTIYVVAFYTDKILLRGGPEGFGGLPGTILGLAIPRYHATWFATKVDAFVDHRTELIPPVKGKKIESEKDLKKLIELFTRYEHNKKENAAEAMRKLYGFTL